MALRELVLFLVLGVWLSVSSTGCEAVSKDGATSLARGKKLYDVSCGACHKVTGVGADGVALPLVGSPWVQGPEGRLVRIALHGVRGPIEMNGRAYNLEMPGLGHIFDDEEMASILTYIRQAWGNRAPPVSVGTVAAIRAATADRGDSWTAEELLELR